MRSGERQVASTLAGVRRDHVARYEWAAGRLGGAHAGGKRVLDLACGVGYGANVLAQAGASVLGLDADLAALFYARAHWAHPRVEFAWADGAQLEACEIGCFDAAVCFETIEHVADPLPMLRALRRCAPLLLASVPNEEVFPFRGHAFHYRHYTRQAFAALLAQAGWRVVEWHGQAGPHSEVEPNCNGRTVMVVAERAAPLALAPEPERYEGDAEAPAPAPAPPAHVAILGLGPSLEVYTDVVRRAGGRSAFCDEAWAINALGDVLQCDRVFHMDDVRIQELRAAAAPDGNIAAMLKWLRRHPGPIYTSRAHPDYPGLVEFPLEAAINDLQYAYFNSTAAYALAYAIHIGVQKVSLFGCDYTYPNAHHAEKGRACLEFWMGVAASRGILIGIPDRSTLMDSMAPLAERLYGYDTLEVDIQPQPDGLAKVAFRPRESIPSAAEIEARYDHSRHPNPLVSGKF